MEQMKVKSELLRVQAAKAEMEYIIEQRMDEISRIHENIKKQEETEVTLLAKLQGG